MKLPVSEPKDQSHERVGQGGTNEAEVLARLRTQSWVRAAGWTRQDAAQGPLVATRPGVGRC